MHTELHSYLGLSIAEIVSDEVALGTPQDVLDLFGSFYPDQVDGVIVHADNNQVYQQIGKNFVMHARSDFDKVPEIGSAKSISYNAQGKAAVAAEAPKLTRGRSM